MRFCPAARSRVGHDGAGRQAGEDVVRGRKLPPAACEPARQRLGLRCGGAALELPEHVQVLLLDHRPRVVAREVLAAVPPEPGVERSVRFEGVQRFRELLVALVIQPGVTPDALSLEHVASAVGEDRTAERPGFERDHREAFEVRGHDQQVSRRERIELVLVRQIPEVVDPMVAGDRDDRLADEHEVQPARERHRIALEVVEELATPLVGIDPPDVDGKGAVDLVPPAGSARGPCAPARRSRRRRPRPERARCAWRRGSSRAPRSELYMIPRTPLKTGPNIERPMVGSRSAVGTSTALPDSRRAACQA